MHSFKDQRLEPSAMGYAQCAFQTLPWNTGNQRLQTRPAAQQSWYAEVPPTFDGNPRSLGAPRRQRVRVPSVGWLEGTVNNNAAVTCRTPSSSLGVAPLVAGSVIAAGGVIGALSALMAEALQDDWEEEEVFRANTTVIDNAMKYIQCLVGGAHEAYGCRVTQDEFRAMQEAESGWWWSSAPKVEPRDCICPSNTKPLCPLSAGTLVEWRTLRGDWSDFYGRAGSTGTALFGGATPGEAETAKMFARRMEAFYKKLTTQVCPPAVRSQLAEIVPQDVAVAARKTTEAPNEAPGWLKWTVIGGAVFTVFMGLKVAKDIFGD